MPTQLLCRYRVAELINADASLQEVRSQAFRATLMHWLDAGP
jgi:hypothetical protein